MTVSKTNSQHWKTAEATVEMSLSTSEGFDFELSSPQKHNDVFSLMEVLVNKPDAIPGRIFV